LVRNAALIHTSNLRRKKPGDYSTDERKALLQYNSFDDRQNRYISNPISRSSSVRSAALGNPDTSFRRTNQGEFSINWNTWNIKALYFAPDVIRKEPYTLPLKWTRERISHTNMWAFHGSSRKRRWANDLQQSLSSLPPDSKSSRA
jgi:hypothetical protein